jgi:hypothetical protein
MCQNGQFYRTHANGGASSSATMVAVFVAVLMCCGCSRDVTRSSYVKIGAKIAFSLKIRISVLLCVPHWLAPYLVCDDSPAMEETYPPPGTQVQRIDPALNMLLAGIVMDIPLSADLSGTPTTIFSSTRVLLLQSLWLTCLLPWLYAYMSLCQILRILLQIVSASSSRHTPKRNLTTGVPTCQIYHSPGWTFALRGKPPLRSCGAFFFLMSSSATSSTPHPPPSTFVPGVNIASAVNLHCDCPPTLLQALAISHLDCEVGYKATTRRGRMELRAWVIANVLP